MPQGVWNDCMEVRAVSGPGGCAPWVGGARGAVWNGDGPNVGVGMSMSGADVVNASGANWSLCGGDGRPAPPWGGETGGSPGDAKGGTEKSGMPDQMGLACASACADGREVSWRTLLAVGVASCVTVSVQTEPKWRTAQQRLRHDGELAEGWARTVLTATIKPSSE